MKKFVLSLVLMASVVLGAMADTILTKDNFKGDWLVGKWEMSFESSDDDGSDTAEVEIRGTKENSKVTLTIDGESESMSFAKFRANIFDEIMASFPDDETIAAIKKLTTKNEFKGDNKLHLNKDKTEMRSYLYVKDDEGEMFAELTFKKMN